MPNTPYQLLKSPQDIDELLKPGAGRHLVFKHSLTCPVSHAAFREFERFLATAPPAGTHVGLIEVQNARPASNRVAEVTGVRHESPQALLVEKVKHRGEDGRNATVSIARCHDTLKQTGNH